MSPWWLSANESCHTRFELNPGKGFMSCDEEVCKDLDFEDHVNKKTEAKAYNN